MVGKTENCTGRRIYRAKSRTMTPKVTLVAKNRSSTNAGTGISMTKTVATAATGSSHSATLGDFAVVLAMSIGGAKPSPFRGWDSLASAFAPGRETPGFPPLPHTVLPESSGRHRWPYKALVPAADFPRLEFHASAPVP